MEGYICLFTIAALVSSSVAGPITTIPPEWLEAPWYTTEPPPTTTPEPTPTMIGDTWEDIYGYTTTPYPTFEPTPFPTSEPTPTMAGDAWGPTSEPTPTMVGDTWEDLGEATPPNPTIGDPWAATPPFPTLDPRIGKIGKELKSK